MNFSNIYNINFSNLANLLTPPFLRKKVLIDWLIALLNPLEEVNFMFTNFRADAIYRVTHNGQVFSLQAALNDSYDNILRRIRIKDSFQTDPVYIYPEADLRPVYIGTQDSEPITYLNDDSIFEVLNLDFLVCIPVEYRPADPRDLEVLTIQIRGLINSYKLASKRYTILWT